MAMTSDTSGQRFDPESLPATYGLNPDGTRAYTQVTDGVTTWRRTFTYDASGVPTGRSGWVRQ